MGNKGEQNKLEVKPYEGDSPFIFVSYSHSDEAIIRKIIYELTFFDYRVWFDAGIHAASIWNKVIADRIASEKCKIGLKDMNTKVSGKMM